MDIHPPHAPGHSWKDLSIQLATITAGIVIALSFEALREWQHDRALVHEARERIAHEIADNMKEVVDDILNKRPSNVHAIDIGATLADLSAAGWQTAQRMGVLAHMDYADVQRCSKLYGIQQLYAEQQRRTLEHATSAMMTITGSPFKAAPKDLEALGERVRQLRPTFWSRNRSASA